MTLPDVTLLQLTVIGSLVAGEASGRDLRERLAALGVKKSGPAFYQMMARLEAAGYVRGWYVATVVSGQPIKERWYKALPPGRKVWRRAAEIVAGVS